MVEMIVAELVRGREVRPDPGELVLLRGASAEGQDLVLVLRAQAAHATVELHVDAGGRAGGVEELAGPYRDVGVRGERGAEVVAGERAHHEQPGGDPGGAQ